MRNATELRKEILAAARADFARYGLAGARIDRIAAAARASKERLYAHFGDKETLFRAVVASDIAAFFRAVPLRPDAIADVVGDIFDLAINQPDHVRMVSWARLEGITLDEPHSNGQPMLEQAIAAIETAQASGRVDSAWQPFDLVVMLFGIGLAWVHSPVPDAHVTDPAVTGPRRAAAIEAARRIIEPRAQLGQTARRTDQ